MYFIEILNGLVEEANLSLRKFAKESDVSATQYSRYLRGSVPTIDIALKIAKYFDCTIDYLFGLEKNKNGKLYKTYNYDMSKFLDKYKTLLNANKITNYKFAQHNSFDESIIRHWKAGSVPRFDIIYTIARELGGSMDDLIGRY